MASHAIPCSHHIFPHPAHHGRASHSSRTDRPLVADGAHARCGRTNRSLRTECKLVAYERAPFRVSPINAIRAHQQRMRPDLLIDYLIMLTKGFFLPFVIIIPNGATTGVGITANKILCALSNAFKSRNTNHCLTFHVDQSGRWLHIFFLHDFSFNNVTIISPR